MTLYIKCLAKTYKANPLKDQENVKSQSANVFLINKYIFFFIF